MAPLDPVSTDPRDDAESAPFLRAEPPPRLARWLAATVIVMFVGAIAATVLIRIPERVSSSFTLRPARGTDPVRSPRDGVVAAVRVSDAQGVRRGDELFVVRSVAVGDRFAELRALETQVGGARDRLANEQARNDSQARAEAEEERALERREREIGERMARHRELREERATKYRATLEILENEVTITEQELDFKRKHLALAQEVAERFERYNRENLVSWLDMANRQLEARKLAVEVQQVEKQLETTRLRVRQLRSEHSAQETEWRVTLEQLEGSRRDTRAAAEKLRHESAARQTGFRELTRRLGEDTGKAAIRVRALTRELGTSRDNEVSIASPCAGTVVRLRVRAPGAVVHDGEVLSELACADDRLQAELTVPQASIGRLKPGLTVKLLYDAFPYQRYGVRYGVVRWVSPASVEAREGQAFRALADLQDDSILVKGERHPLAAGMTGRADVLVGRRSLMSYAFEPLRQLRETLADGPAR